MHKSDSEPRRRRQRAPNDGERCPSVRRGVGVSVAIYLVCVAVDEPLF